MFRLLRGFARVWLILAVIFIALSTLAILLLYGRLLAYVILPDGRNFAEVMIAERYGFEYTYSLPCRYRAEFQAAQRAARERERGL